jgi:hypothetical protein
VEAGKLYGETFQPIYEARKLIQELLSEITELGHFQERRSQIFRGVASPHHEKSGIFFPRDHLMSSSNSAMLAAMRTKVLTTNRLVVRTSVLTNQHLDP